jgi:hypothetical protein
MKYQRLSNFCICCCLFFSSFSNVQLQEKKAIKSQPEQAQKLISFEDEDTGLWGFKDENEKIIIKPQFYFAYDFTGNIAAVALHDGWYYIDKSGNILKIRSFIYDNGPDYFKEDLARFTLEGKIGFLNEKGEVVIEPLKFNFVSPFFDSLAVVCFGCKEVREDEHALLKGGKWGYIDRTGKIVIPLKFEAAEPFQNGKARVMLNGKWTFINKEGKIINN